jgi:hypothetical protein
LFLICLYFEFRLLLLVYLWKTYGEKAMFLCCLSTLHFNFGGEEYGAGE